MQFETRSDSRLFTQLLRSLLKDGISVRFRAHGRSMYPAITDGEVLQVEPNSAANRGDIVMVETTDGLRVHRVIQAGDAVQTRGDCCFETDDGPRQLAGSVSIVDGDITRPPGRRRLGTVVRCWVARWRGHF